MDNNGKRVIVADDEPIIRINIIEILESMGYDVCSEACDGFEVLSECKKYHPDIVLLDIKMPFLDGLAAAKHIRDNHLASTIIIITAFSDADLVRNAVDIGIDGYLVKPVTKETLLPTLELAVAHSLSVMQLKKSNSKKDSIIIARKNIDRAKGILMDEQQITEQQAYLFIRNQSKKQNVSMEKVAEIIIKAHKSSDV
jgi:Response regulator with putative antiterminator output domain